MDRVSDGSTKRDQQDLRRVQYPCKVSTEVGEGVSGLRTQSSHSGILAAVAAIMYGLQMSVVIR